MADLADHAYAHAVAVLGAGAAAEHAAVRGVRQGGRARWSVLGHARHAALTAAPGPQAGASVITATSPVPGDLTELARVLAGTRPAAERAIVDLETRHGLDRRDLARALGLAPAAAAALAAAVASSWEHALDPVLLAHLGPGGCETFEGILEAAGLWCPPAASPVLPPMPLPPPPAAGNGGAADPKPGTGPVPVAQDTPVFVPSAGDPAPGPPAAGAGEQEGPPVTLATLVAAAPMVTDHVRVCPAWGERRRSMVSVRSLLARVPVGTAPEAVRVTAPARLLRRPSPPPPVLGQARAPRTRRGLVAAALAVLALAGAWAWAERGRGGGLRVGGGGRAVQAPATVRVDRPPMVEASASGCAVTARVGDDGSLGAVLLHWSDPASPEFEESAPMRPGDDGYAGALPPSAVPLTWWVTAADDRGNTARSPAAVLDPGAC